MRKEIGNVHSVDIPRMVHSNLMSMEPLLDEHSICPSFAEELIASYVKIDFLVKE